MQNLKRKIEQVVVEQQQLDLAKSLGFSSLLDIARFRTLDQFLDALAAKTELGKVSNHSEHSARLCNLYTDDKTEQTIVFNKAHIHLYRYAKKLAGQVDNIWRDKVSANDPVSSQLRGIKNHNLPVVRKPVIHCHAEGYSDSAMDSAGDIIYTDPDSIQSALSPAAYLAHIWELADSHIAFSDNFKSLSLDKRRPDLKDLVLSEDSLKHEVPTLLIANEILESQLLDVETNPEQTHLNWQSPEDIYQWMNSQHHPLAMPYNHPHQQVRTSLDTMNGLSLNSVLLKTSADDFSIADDNYTVAPLAPEPLNLFDEHVVLLSTADPSVSDVYQDWYGLTDSEGASDLNIVDNFLRTTSLSYEELRQLVRDYPVVDDCGIEYDAKSVYASFNTEIVTLGKNASDELILEAPGAAAHAQMNKMVRLYQRTGMALHELDWLMQSYRLSDPESTKENFSTALPVLARYRWWQKQYDLSADEFSAFYCRLNPYKRDGFQETSQLRQLFSDHAIWIQQLITDGKQTLFSALSEHQQVALAQGLKLSNVEWQQIVALVDPDRSRLFDSACLSALYRLSHLYPLLGWDVLTGLALTKSLDKNLLHHSALLPVLAGEPGSAILTAMERLAWLAEWMNSTGISPDILLLVLSNPEQTVSQASQETLTWLTGFHQDIQPLRLSPSSLNPFSAKVTGLPKTVFPTAEQWWSGLLHEGVRDEYGCIKALTKTAIRQAVDKIASDAAGNGETSTAQQQETSAELTDFLLQRQAQQYHLLATHLSKQSPLLNNVLVNDMLGWMGTDSYDSIVVLLTWDYPPADWSESAAGEPWPGGTPLDLQTLQTQTRTLQALFNLHRHITVVNTLGLSAATLEMLNLTPQWFSSASDTLDLYQFYLLQVFNGLKWSEASASEWQVYFAKINSDSQVQSAIFTERQCDRKAVDIRVQNTDLLNSLARLLNWPANEIAAVCRDLFAGNLPLTIRETGYLNRHIALFQELASGYEDFKALINLTADTADWQLCTTAATALITGLNRYEHYQAPVFSPYTEASATGSQLSIGDTLNRNDTRQESLLLVARDELAEHLRNALIAAFKDLVVASNALLKETITSDNDLYNYFLLDVYVTHQVPTTRLLEAIGSVQTYINGALQGVEPAEITDRAGLDEIWELSSQYRVWEANEKLGLYPENYIESDLRLGQSALFKQFEQDLGQGTAGKQLVDQAIANYVNDLSKLAEMEVSGYCYDINNGEITFYFTARARWEQNTFYYRTLTMNIADAQVAIGSGTQPYQTWSDWVRIALPVQNQVYWGVSPAFSWNTLYLFWVELEQRRENNGTDTTYILRPKYCRKTLDGNWSAAQNISVSGEDIAVNYTQSFDLKIEQAVYNDENNQLEMGFEYDDGTPVYYAVGITPNTAFCKHEGFFPGSISVNGYHELVSRDTNIQYQLSSYSATRRQYKWNVSSFQGGSWNLTMNLQNADLSVTGSIVQMLLREFYIDISMNNMTGITIENTIKVYDNNNTILTQKNLNTVYATRNGSYRVSESQLSFDMADSMAYFTVAVDIKFVARVASGPTYIKDEPEKFIFDHYSYRNEIERIPLDHKASVFIGEDNGDEFLVWVPKQSDSIAIRLNSNAAQQLSEKLQGKVTDIFLLQNQYIAEPNCQQFIDAFNQSYNEYSIKQPFPLNNMDFDGAFGHYFWELFFHLPLKIADASNKQSEYKIAQRWQQIVYRPGDEQTWGVRPLIEVDQATQRDITNPDEVATRNPMHYQLSTIRHYLENIRDEGDRYYRQVTPEMMRQAKLSYTSAMNLFEEDLNEVLNTLLTFDWQNPTLGNVTADHFYVPYNAELRELYSELEQKMVNLRNWCTIDGEPLNIPLIAAPINPRELQKTALAEEISSTSAQTSAPSLPYTFDTIFSKAKGYVNNLMAFGSYLQSGLESEDGRQLDDLQQTQEIRDVTGLKDLAYLIQEEKVAIEQQALRVLQTTRDIYATQLAHNTVKKVWAQKRLALSMLKYAVMKASKSASTVMWAVGIGMEIAPNTFGLANGGMELGAVPKSSGKTGDGIAEKAKDDKDSSKEKNNWDEKLLNLGFKAAEIGLELTKIDREIEQQKLTVEQEETRLREADQQRKNAKEIMTFYQKRFSNTAFYAWYTAQMSSYYNAAYDATLNFCLMAEKAYQLETGLGNTFIQPQWNEQYKGLLAGQGLMVDLERMDLSYMQNYEPPLEDELKVSLRELDESALESLINQGSCLFNLSEALFDEDYPHHYQRRIKSVRLVIPSLEKFQRIGAQLTQVSHTLYLDRNKDKTRTARNYFVGKQVAIPSWTFDSAQPGSGSQSETGRGRLLPFQGTGVESCWELSFPGAVKALADNKRGGRHTDLLQQLDDVELYIRYTARA